MAQLQYTPANTYLPPIVPGYAPLPPGVAGMQAPRPQVYGGDWEPPVIPPLPPQFQAQPHPPQTWGMAPIPIPGPIDPNPYPPDFLQQDPSEIVAARFPAFEAQQQQQMYTPYAPPPGFPPVHAPPYMAGGDLLHQSQSSANTGSTSRRRRRRRRRRDLDQRQPTPFLPDMPPALLRPVEGVEQDMVLFGVDNNNNKKQAPVSTYNVDQPMARPNDWRKDYHPRPNIFHRIAANSTTTYFSKFNINLHPTLACTSEIEQPFTMDLTSADPDIHFNYLQRSANEIDYIQVATHPSVQEWTLYHPKLPWFITLRSGHPPNGITVKDVLRGVREQLMESVVAADYYNVDLNAEDRERMWKAFERRCKGDPAHLVQGIKKVDFLERDCVWIGIRRAKGKINGRDDVWEIVTRCGAMTSF